MARAVLAVPSRTSPAGRSATGLAPCRGSRTPGAATGTALALAVVAMTGCGGGGGDGGGEDAERKVHTTDAGTTIVRTTSEREGLRVEVQDSSVYVSATDATPGAVRSVLRGKPLGGRCTLKDGRTIGTIQLLWREDPGDWGASLEVQGVYEEQEPLANVVRSCEIRRGVSAGPGRTDINAGPVLTTATFEQR